MEGYETTQLRQDGSVIHLLVSAVPWRDEAGQIIGAHGTAVDLTEQKKLHARLQHAERLTTVGTLAAGVAHEINNPLAYVVSNLAFARDELKEALATGAPRPSLERGAVEEVVKSLEDASMGADRVRRIVRDLKVFSRRESAELGPVSVEQSLEAALKMAHNELRFRAQLVRRYSEVPPVEANEAQLGQVFLNLLINAAQAIPEGHASRNEVCVSTLLNPEGKVVVEVRDTGSGIPPEVLPRIFDPFFTTKQIGVGTGLGLSTCHGIVKGLGGELLVETQVGVGTVFKVVLPPSRGERPSPTPQPIPPAVRRGRVLVVDDEVAVGRVLSKLLQAAHEVVVLHDGREALKRIVSGERFDAILCDLMMPDLSGCELHAELEKVAPHAAQRMVFVTGGAFSPEAIAFLERVPNRQLDKPIDRVALSQALNAVLGLPA
jgi:signal transduction histidine kinase/CheY-like chemotaxis protein